jgi:hypothetical protein
MNETIWVMTKSYKYNMFGAYRMLDEGSHYRFVFLKDHKKNAGSRMPQDDKIIPKENISYYLEYYYLPN